MAGDLRCHACVKTCKGPVRTPICNMRVRTASRCRTGVGGKRCCACFPPQNLPETPTSDNVVFKYVTAEEIGAHDPTARN